METPGDPTGPSPSVVQSGGLVGWRGGIRHLTRADAVVPVLTLLALPWVLLLLEPNWIYSKLLRDNWIYFGYFVNLPGHLRAFGDHYYGSRLSAIYPGYLAYRWLPPVIANCVLDMVLYETCVLSLYLTLKRVTGFRAAWLAALAMGTNPGFLESIGRGYVDGFGMAYYLAAVLLVTRAAGSRYRRVLLIGSGAAGAALVVANLFYAVFIPALVLLYGVSTRHEPIATRTRGAGLILAGAGGLFLVLAACNGVVTGRYNFLGPSFAFASDSGTSKWRLFSWQSLETLCGAVPLAVPATALLAILATRHRPPARVCKDPALCRALTGQFLLSLAAYLAYAQLFNAMVLFNYYYANMLIAPSCLALAVPLSYVVDGLDRRGFLALAAGAFVTLLLPFALPPTGSELDRLGLTPSFTAAVPVVLAFLLFRTTRPGVMVGWLLFAMFGLCNYVSQPLIENEINEPLRTNAVLAARHRAYNRDRRSVFLAIHEGLAAVLDVDRANDVYFWFNASDVHGYLFDHIAATGAMLRVYGTAFPTAEPARTKPGTKLAVLSSEPDGFDRARASLRRIGFDARQIASREIHEGWIKFRVSLLEVIGPP